LNTPVRLALWSRKMRDLYRQVEHIPQGHCPVHLLEKAYRCADHLATRLHTAPRADPRRCQARATTRLGPWRRWLSGAMQRLASPQSAERALALARLFLYDPFLHHGHGNRA